MLHFPIKTARKLAEKIDAYFVYIEGDYHFEEKSATEQKKVWDRDAEPATITGLALFLGFTSRQQFEDYEQNGEFASVLKRGRLQVEVLYERKLHQQAPAGAIFALKSMGWNEKPEDKTNAGNSFTSIKIEILETGLKPAKSEKEVEL